MFKVDKDHTLFEVCKQIQNEIQIDFGGGSLVEKIFLRAFLAQDQNLKSYAEIGVYKGNSFFPIAAAIHKNGGKSYGIDPYQLNDAKEEDLDENIKNQVNTFLETLDFEKLYESVVLFKEKCDYGESIKLLRKTSEEAFKDFKEDKVELDLLHIDGNHDTKFVRYDYETYYELLKTGGFIIFDDIDWPSVKVIYEQAKKECIEIFKDETFGILLKEPKSTKSLVKASLLSEKLNAVYSRVTKFSKEVEVTPTVGIGILTYNQVDYIEQCLYSTITQYGNFKLKVVICDDCSNDGTSEKIKQLLSTIKQTDHLKISYVRNEKNIGVIPNLKQLIRLLKDSDYFTFCEGDDYYLSPSRIYEHLKYHNRNPQTVFSFNKLLLYLQDKDTYEIFEPDTKSTELTTEILATENVAGNLAASFYNGDVLKHFDEKLFDIFAGDWMLTLVTSQYGDIGILNKPLSVYRKHDKGVWGGFKEIDKLKIHIKNIDDYNKYLNYNYDKYFTIYRNRCVIKYEDQYVEPIDLLIIDDVFPHPISGFRYQEFTSIFKNIKSSKVLTTAESLTFLGNKDINELLIDYKRDNPEYANKVQSIHDIANYNAKLLYCTFINNAFHNVLYLAEAYKIPFIFTLYPGGGFGLNNETSDFKLKRIFASPCFKKVIVTQTVTYNYLIENKLCPKDKIEFIFGVVTPLEKLELNLKEKKHYKFDKETLDICFVAHKYTKYGEDKGYDIFLDVAKQISKNHDNVHFHVVGQFNKDVLNVNGIKNLKFYGIRDQDWFDKFYQDKDLVLSPNINGQIFKGSFDGFPTGSLTDAALRKVAMFCTDPLELNNNKFIDKKDIVIVHHDVQDIVEKIEFYIAHPAKLKSISENGYKKTKDLYGYKKQIEPRVTLLKEALKEPFIYSERDFNNLPSLVPKPIGERRSKGILRKLTPKKIKKSYHKTMHLKRKLFSL